MTDPCRLVYRGREVGERALRCAPSRWSWRRRAGCSRRRPTIPRHRTSPFRAGSSGRWRRPGALGASDRRGARLLLRLPAPAEGDAALIADGVRRYAAARRAADGLRLAGLRREGVQTLLLALGVIRACMFVWFLVELLPGEGLVKVLARDGLVVAAWVALWRPLDLLLFETWLVRRDRRILEAVAAMPVVVEPADRVC